MPVSEKKQVAGLFIICILVAAVAILAALAIPALFEGDLVIDSYEATFGTDGSLTETYVYDVRTTGEYRMLYRYWEDSLSLKEQQYPNIQFVSMDIPPGVTGYVKEFNGVVTLENSDSTDEKMIIVSLAERNEVGIYNPDYFISGQYTVLYSYLLHPPVEYDDSVAHLNIRLVDEHIPYRDLTIRYPSRYVREVYPHPATLNVERTEQEIIITGHLAGDEKLGIELILEKDAMNELQGFPSFVENVEGETRAANPWYAALPSQASLLLYYLSIIAVIATPFLFLYIYHRYGREKEFVVPEYLSYVPDPKMKPWSVNLLFKGDAIDFDKDGYYATLLDMHRRKIVRITESEGVDSIKIEILHDTSEDPYEQKIIGFLQDAGQDGVVDTGELKKLADRAKTDHTAETVMLRYQRELAGVTRKSDPALIAKYIVNGRDHVLPPSFLAVAFCAISVIMIIAIPVLAPILIPAALLFGVMILQCGIAMAFPSTLFGHWKDDRYREKLEWDAFAKFLSDLALMKQYSPADLSMWGIWLIYGTALGKGDKVEKAMKELNISIPEAGVPLGFYGAFIPVMAFTPPSKGGSGGFGGGGGSFGGGGGFGGGGVGGR
jgi:uncharacterized membrane protein